MSKSKTISWESFSNLRSLDLSKQGSVLRYSSARPHGSFFILYEKDEEEFKQKLQRALAVHPLSTPCEILISRGGGKVELLFLTLSKNDLAIFQGILI